MYEYSCAITRVVDGDTVDVDIDLGFGVWMRKQRIRLYGVDTPESRTRDLVEKKHGFAAKEFVQSYLPVGTTQTLRTKLDDRGKFGRILGEFVAFDSVNDRQSTVNDLLVSNYHAVPYFGQSKEDIEEGHLENRKKVKL
jgi:micrococcal nuclease